MQTALSSDAAQKVYLSAHEEDVTVAPRLQGAERPHHMRLPCVGAQPRQHLQESSHLLPVSGRVGWAVRDS